MSISWNSEFSVMRQLVTDRNDLLQVKNGQLVLTKGNRLRNNSIDLTLQPDQLAAHLERLINVIGKAQFEQLKNSSHNLELLPFRNEVSVLGLKLSQLSLLMSKFGSFSNQYRAIRDANYKFYVEVNNYISDQDIPHLNQSQNWPVVHLQYDEWMDYSVGYMDRVPLNELSVAAREALNRSELTVSKAKRNAITAAKIILLAIPLLISSWIHPLKKFVWNPMERAIRGGVRTESPFDRIINFIFPNDRHKKNFIDLSNRILLRNVIDQEVVGSFVPLIPYLETIPLYHAHFAEHNTGMELVDSQLISKEHLMTILEASVKSPRCKSIELSKVLRERTEIKEWMAQNDFRYVDDWGFKRVSK